MRAYKLVSGKGRLTFREIAGDPVDRTEIEIPCGQCIGCRLERGRQWAIRCVHEAKMHASNVFVTLTYATPNLPAFGSLDYRDVQLFFKRLRKARYGNAKGSLRYFCCGEYGELLSRPHYHAILFGIAFPDSKPWKKENGNQLYTSEELTRLWGKGHCSLGAVTFESAAYVARYSMKKLVGPMSDSHYRRVDPETGEVAQLEPEFGRMSRNPGIGTTWWMKYRSDVKANGTVVSRGREANPPRFYLNKLEKEDPEKAEAFKQRRIERGYQKFLEGECKEGRLRAQECVAKAQVNLKRRNYETGSGDGAGPRT